MADDETPKPGTQPTLPNVDSDAIKAAEKRVKDAEAKAAKLEADERKRQAEADKARRDSEMRSIDDAKRALEAAEAKAAEFEERAKAAEDRIRKRIDSRFEQLPADTRERMTTFREAMPLEKWEQLVDMELERTATSETNATNDDSASRAVLPPVSAAGAGRRVHARDGRELHPKTVEILESLGQGTDLARKVLQVEREVEGGITRGRFVYPQGLLKKHLRERALAPVLMTEENRKKIFGV